MITIKPTGGKVWIKPDPLYVADKDETGAKIYKKSKESLIVIPEKTAEAKNKDYLVGTVVDFCGTAGLDFPSGIRHHTFQKGERVAYIGMHVSIIKHEGENFHMIPSEFIWGTVHGEPGKKQIEPIGYAGDDSIPYFRSREAL